MELHLGFSTVFLKLEQVLLQSLLQLSKPIMKELILMDLYLIHLIKEERQFLFLLMALFLVGLKLFNL